VIEDQIFRRVWTVYLILTSYKWGDSAGWTFFRNNIITVF